MFELPGARMSFLGDRDLPLNKFLVLLRKMSGRGEFLTKTWMAPEGQVEWRVARARVVSGIVVPADLREMFVPVACTSVSNCN